MGASNSMKAITHTSYGSPDMLAFQEVEAPTPGAHEVLVQVQAAAANAGDWHLVRGEPFLVRLDAGLRQPKHQVPGADMAGRVAAVGHGVTQFRPGDEVFGDLSGSGYGAFAEYVSSPESALVQKPSNLTFEQVVTAPSAALTALQGLRDIGEIQAGQRVLINGASGGVGSFAVQIAKAFGAEVTGVCSTKHVEMVRAIGADHVIDYKQEDFTQNGHQYDLILDAAAYRPLVDYKRSLTPTGRYVLIGGAFKYYLQAMVTGPWHSKKDGQQFKTFIKKSNQADLLVIRDLLEAGKIVPVIDRRYSLEQVPEAIRYLEEGHASGKIVISVASEASEKEETR